jgi:hypothetical protein
MDLFDFLSIKSDEIKKGKKIVKSWFFFLADSLGIGDGSGGV